MTLLPAVTRPVSPTRQHPGPGTKLLKVQLNVFNLMNRREVTAISPNSTPAFDQYLFQAPRSVQLSAKVEF